MNWEDKLKKQAEGFYIGLGDLQSETSFMDGVNYATDKIMGKIKEMIDKLEESRSGGRLVGAGLAGVNITIIRLTKLLQWIEGGSE